MDEPQNAQTSKFSLEMKISLSEIPENERDLYLNLLIGNVSSVLKFCWENFSYSPEAIEKIVLVDSDSLGPAIYELQDAAGHRRGYVSERDEVEDMTVSKVISKTKEDGSVISTIVLLGPPYVNLITEVLQAGTEYQEWTAEQQMFVHVMAVSLGSAHDAFIRQRISEETEEDFLKSRDWQATSRYYAGVLTTNFLSAYYAGKVVSQQLQDFLALGWEERYKALVDNVLAHIMSAFGNIENAAPSNLWAIMIQYTKFVGHQAANPELTLPPPREFADDDERQVFIELEDFLKNKLAPNSLISDGRTIHPSQDPNFDLEGYVFNNLYPIWKKFGECLGVSFNDVPLDENDEEDFLTDLSSREDNDK